MQRKMVLCLSARPYSFCTARASQGCASSSGLSSVLPALGVFEHLWARPHGWFFHEGRGEGLSPQVTSSPLEVEMQALRCPTMSKLPWVLGLHLAACVSATPLRAGSWKSTASAFVFHVTSSPLAIIAPVSKSLSLLVGIAQKTNKQRTRQSLFQLAKLCINM